MEKNANTSSSRIASDSLDEEGLVIAMEGGGKQEETTVQEQPSTDATKGLTSEQVAEALAKFGPNEIPAHSTPLYMIFVMQFAGFLPFLIEVAALVSLAVQDYTDFGIIAGILLINGALGFREEYHAKKSLDEVSQSLEAEIMVVRDGNTERISVKDIVPGDLVFLTGGVIVPADVLWLRGDTLQLDTAALTGEPLPRKYPSEEYGKILLAGTTVAAGECYGQVLNTGSNTEIGKAQEAILQDKVRYTGCCCL